MSSSSRQAILSAAKDLIAREGPGVSLAEVAAEAGVSRQAVYLHFGSRAGMLVALVRDMDQEAGIEAKLDEALRLEDPLEAFRAFVRAWLRFALAIQPVATPLYAAKGTDPAAREAWEDRSRELRRGFHAAVVGLGEAGLLRPGLSAGSAASLAWALCSVPVVEQLTADLGWSPDRVVRETLNAVVGALVR